MERATMSVEQMAEFLGISRWLAYKLIGEGAIPVLRLGKRILVPRESLTEWMAARASSETEPVA